MRFRVRGVPYGITKRKGKSTPADDLRQPLENKKDRLLFDDKSLSFFWLFYFFRLKVSMVTHRVFQEGFEFFSQGLLLGRQ